MSPRTSRDRPKWKEFLRRELVVPLPTEDAKSPSSSTRQTTSTATSGGRVNRIDGRARIDGDGERVVVETSRARTAVELLVVAIAIAGVAVGIQQAKEIGKQLKQQVAIEQGATDRELLSAIRDIDAMFVDAPELRPYFYDERPLPDEHLDRARVLAAAERLLDTADAVASARRHGLLTADDWAGWRAAFHSYYDESPALRIVWHDFAYFLSDETQQLLTDAAQSRAGLPSDETRWLKPEGP